MPDSDRAQVSAAEFRELFRSLSTWGRWGPLDERGALNYITADRVAEAARLVSRGITVSLSWPLNTDAAAHNPLPAEHRMTSMARADDAGGADGDPNGRSLPRPGRWCGVVITTGQDGIARWRKACRRSSGVLQLRVYGSRSALAEVADRLEGVEGARHVSLSAAADSDRSLVTADLRTAAADGALARLSKLGISPDDVVLVRLDTIGLPAASSEPLTVVWADVLGQARAAARAPARYLVLMAVAGVIGAFAVTNESPVLLVGAMATSPDLLPVTATSTGLVLRRPRLVARGLATLLVGLAVAALLAAAVTGFLDLFGLLPDGFQLSEIPAAQTHVNATTVIVALVAGVAGMLAVETRASAAVGVAISVTTIPAAAYLGVAIGTGELDKSSPALAILAVNIVMMLLGGSTALAVQAQRRDRPLKRGARRTTAHEGHSDTRGGVDRH